MAGNLRRKLVWLLAGRAAVITLLLGSAVLIAARTPGAATARPFLLIIGVTYALTALYGLALHAAERHRWIVDLQLGVDAVIVSAIVLLTGGVSSNWSSLYTLPIIAASTIESRRGGMMVGVLGSLLYGGLVAAQYSGQGLLPAEFTVQSLPPRQALLIVGLNVFGFLAVASLSGYLAEGLRRADERLAQASDQIADLQAFSQHVIDSLMSGLATTDIDGTILTFNRTASAITGIEPARAVGARVADVLQLPGDFAGFFGRRDGRPDLPRVEYAYTRQSGQQIEMGLSTATLITPRGETGFLFTFRDVTEARRREREARVQQRLAAVGEMAAGIAHEIRNPLASMSGSIQILRHELPLTPDQTQLMDIVLRESERLNDTIRSFLAYARPQRAGIARMDVRQVVTETARLLQNSAELSDAHAVRVDVPPGEVCFEGDEGQIRQIVWNLATNGLRAMPSGGALTLATAVGEGDQAGELQISVRDEGVGIAAEDIDGIFQPVRGGFSKGTGLGLSIVHRIVSDYGGQVRVTSQPGKGTTVTVALPIAVQAHASL